MSTLASLRGEMCYLLKLANAECSDLIIKFPLRKEVADPLARDVTQQGIQVLNAQV